MIGLTRFLEAGDGGLEDRDACARAARERAITAATTDLPTSVPVPVTNNPFMGAP